jgi:hypothetical protein
VGTQPARGADLDGALGDYEVDYSYLSYVDVERRIVMSGTGDQGTGTVTFQNQGGDEVVCDLTREAETVNVFCQ